MRFFLIFLFYVSVVQARLLQDEITGEVVFELNFKEACQIQGHPEPLLVDAVGTDKLDCMGKIISASTSCLKKKTDGFLKAHLEGKNVRCIYGKQVIISIECDERDKSYCRDSQKSCLVLRPKFAMQLDLLRHSVVEREKAKVLNCFFDSAKNDLPSLN